jgi:hypothetical protein
MKKQLLFGVALAVGLASYAQQNSRVSLPRKSVPFKRLEALKGDEVVVRPLSLTLRQFILTRFQMQPLPSLVKLSMTFRQIHQLDIV